MAGLDPGQAKPPSRALERAFAGLCLAAALLPLLLLFVLLADVVYDGLSRLDWAFLTSYPSRRPERAGVLAGLVGSFYLVGLTALIALPLGVGAAVYLEEYGGRGLSYLAAVMVVEEMARCCATMGRITAQQLPGGRRVGIHCDDGDDDDDDK